MKLDDAVFHSYSLKNKQTKNSVLQELTLDELIPQKYNAGSDCIADAVFVTFNTHIPPL